MRVAVIEHISLDGVIQSPARPDEDETGGFRHGGWVEHGDDPALTETVGRVMGSDFAWLPGHRSYDGMLSYWNAAGGPFNDGLNGAQKYATSSDAEADLPWPNSTLLTGDVPAEVSALREKPDGTLVVMGSAELVTFLLPRGLVDDLLLMIHPIVLGSGIRLFGPSDEPTRMRLVDAKPTASGVVLVTYRSDADAAG